MEVPFDTKFEAERKQYAFCFTCEHCAHFDADTSKHAHFICSGCDTIIDVRGVQNIDWRTMKDLVGCEVEDQTVVFTGRCAGCRQSTKEA